MKTLLYFFTLLLGSGIAQAQNEPVLATDLMKIAQPGSLSFSPDGSRYVFTVRKIEGEGYLTQIWIGESSGSAPRALTHSEAGASQPVWHPNGTDIAFVRPVDKRPQIHLLSLRGGEPVVLTDHPNGASNPVFSPDGRLIVFSTSLSETDLAADSVHKAGPPWNREIAGNPRVHPDTKPSPDGDLAAVRAWLAENAANGNPRVVNRLNFQGETNLNHTMSFTHIMIQEATPGATPRALTSGWFSFAGATFTRNGDFVLVSAALDSTTHPDRVNRQDIYGIPVHGGVPQRAATLAGFSLFNPSLSPDGRYLLVQGFDRKDPGYAQGRLFIQDQSTGVISELSTQLDRSLGNPKWSRDGRNVYATAASDGGFPLFRFDVRTKSVTRLTPFEHGIGDYDVSANSLIMVRTEITNPYELYLARLDASQARRVSDLNHHWVSKKRLSRPEMGRFIQDGHEIQYWIMKPSRFESGKTYPLVLNIHGGPSAMWGPGEASMWHEFQFLASRGYGIVYSNPRGSGGYGRNFQAANFQDWGVGPASDVLTAASLATATGWVDANRQVVTGGSYAGYLTAWIISQDHRFKAAMAQRGVYELTTFMGEGNAWRLVPNHFGGYPWEPEIDEILKRNSPLTYVDRIRTPLLIKHGDNDLRTGVIQSEMLYRSLKIQGKDVEYIRYPRASHEMSRSGEPTQRIDRLLRMVEFFERHIQH